MSFRIRKHLCVLLGAAMLCLMLAPAAVAQPLPTGGIPVYINGTLLQTDVPSVIVNGHILVQMRPIFEALGATVQWNPADKTITATEGDTIIKLQIGSLTAYKNGNPVNLYLSPMLVRDHTMVPGMFVSWAFGYKVTWDAANRQVDITGP